MQTMSLRWQNTVDKVHNRWLRALPIQTVEFERILYLTATRPAADAALYRLLRSSVPVEPELFELLDKLGGWFLSRRSWTVRQERRMVVRSMNRWFNDQSANKKLQLLAIICAHEFGETYAEIST